MRLETPSENTADRRRSRLTIAERLERHGITFERIGPGILIITGHVDDERRLCATLKCSRDELQAHLRQLHR